MSYDTPKLPAVACRSRAAIEQCTLRLIQRHYPNLLVDPSPFPVAKFAEIECRKHYGFKMGPKELDPEIEAYSDTARSIIYLREDVYEDLWEGNGRARFTAAHELGHLFLHHSGTRTQCKSSEQKNILYRKEQLPPYMDPEWQAGSFAGSLLMPLPAVQLEWRKCGYAPVEMAETFNVSRAAARVRLDILLNKGLLTDLSLWET